MRPFWSGTDRRGSVGTVMRTGAIRGRFLVMSMESGTVMLAAVASAVSGLGDGWAHSKFRMPCQL